MGGVGDRAVQQTPNSSARRRCAEAGLALGWIEFSAGGMARTIYTVILQRLPCQRAYERQVHPKELSGHDRGAVTPLADLMCRDRHGIGRPELAS